MNLLNCFKNFLGLYNVNRFESEILSLVEQNLKDLNLKAWKDQFNRFNRVERVLENDDRVKCGSTSFYWIQSGKSQIEFPIKFKFETDVDRLAELEIEIENGDNHIKVILKIVKGAFFRIEYYSKLRVFQPKGHYKITLIKIYQ